MPCQFFLRRAFYAPAQRSPPWFWRPAARLPGLP
jgi:hypothetical protein